MEIVWFLILSLLGGLGSLFFFLYHLKKGHFEEIEEVKYQVFWEDEHDAKIQK